jgi:hypothetical protein
MDTRDPPAPLAVELFLTLGAVGTSAAIAFVLFLTATYAHLDLSSLMLRFIIPIGALLSGAAASSGYHFASLAMDQPPTEHLAVNMTVIGLSTYMLMKYFSYLALRFDDGTPVLSIVPLELYVLGSVKHGHVPREGRSS